MIYLSKHEGVWDRAYVEDEAAALELRQLKARKQMGVFDTGQRYNSAFSIAFSLDHDNEDASDLTSLDYVRAILRRLEDVASFPDPGWDEVLDCWDTMPNPDFPQEEDDADE